MSGDAYDNGLKAGRAESIRACSDQLIHLQYKLQQADDRLKAAYRVIDTLNDLVATLTKERKNESV